MLWGLYFVFTYTHEAFVLLPGLYCFLPLRVVVAEGREVVVGDELVPCGKTGAGSRQQ